MKNNNMDYFLIQSPLETEFIEKVNKQLENSGELYGFPFTKIFTTKEGTTESLYCQAMLVLPESENSIPF